MFHLSQKLHHFARGREGTCETTTFDGRTCVNWESAFVSCSLLFEAVHTPHATTDSISAIPCPGHVTIQFDQLRFIASVAVLDFLQIFHGTIYITELKLFDVDDVIC